MINILNTIFLYSLLGFILESVVYKIKNSNNHSSIFYGPYTLIYGIGFYFCIIIYNNIIFTNNFLINYLFYFISFIIITTTIEFIGGHLIHFLLNIDKWNYQHHKYHFGKYICLDYSIYWGILSLFTITYLHPFLNNNIIEKLPNKTTYLILFIFLIDLTLVIKNKIIKKGNKTLPIII